MVSRIDIGPEGGPFVAINENSNDLELQDINGNVIAKWDETAGQWDLNNNSLTGINAINASSANVGSLGTERHFAGGFEGADPDLRLDAALENASSGDTIYLEKEDYSANRTISTTHTIVGSGGVSNQDGSTISGTWEIASRCDIRHVSITTDMNFNNDDIAIIDCFIIAATVSTNQDRTTFISLAGFNATIEFESGTSGGLADSITRVTVTDNGTNTVGDIA